MQQNEIDQITLRIINSGSYKELVDILNEVGTFISYSRPMPKEHNAERIIQGIGLIRQGWPINTVTRVCGIRSKVAELVISNNYGDPWEEEQEQIDSKI